MKHDYTLYGGELSLYTGKVRAYMRFKALDWQEVLATREIYKEIIIPRVGSPIIPVLETAEGETVQDTTEIIDFIEARHPEASVYPEGPSQKLVALLFELFGDEWLKIPAMHYRWSVLDQQREFIFLEFGKVSAPQASEREQLAIGEKVSARFSGSVTALGITEETIPGIERAYLQLLRQLDKHFAQYPYLLGSRPSIGDYGLIGPLYAHLGRDPVPKAIMQAEAPNVYAWVQRMNDPEPLSGDFLPSDQIPPTLLPILETVCREQFPDALSVVEHNASWLQKNPGGSIPRSLGMHKFEIGGIAGERIISSYTQWMFQRPLRHYQSLRGSDKEIVDSLLKGIGGYDAMQTQLSHPLIRKRGQLELVEDRQ